MKNIAILGSTGSIGKNALKVAAHLPEQLRVVAIAAKQNIDLLEEQARFFQPEVIAVYDEDKALELQRRLPGQRVVAGMEGLLAVATLASADLVVSAMVGTYGLMPTVAAIDAGKDVGLANKEALVSGGALVMQKVKEKGVNLLPIDSEHSALFQCLLAGKHHEVRRLVLTSSGGPFRGHTSEQLQKVTLEEALNHPTWKMGPKITIDSSTLMNKGLEVIEAHWLFDLPPEQIDVVVHPQSVIHSMVEFRDGAMMAEMGEPDMLVPIQYALTFPAREEGLLEPFDFTKHQQLNFMVPDPHKFRCLGLAFDAIREGGTLPCYMNAANEVLVHRFLDRQFEWNEIAIRLEHLMERHNGVQPDTLDVINEVDRVARQEAAAI